MTVYEQIENMFNEASTEEKCKITDKLDAMAKNFNKYIDENYYPCPNCACSELIKYGEALQRYEYYEHMVPKHHPAQDGGTLELESHEVYKFNYYCPKCGKPLYGDYEFRLFNYKLKEAESK